MPINLHGYQGHLLEVLTCKLSLGPRQNIGLKQRPIGKAIHLEVLKGKLGPISGQKSGLIQRSRDQSIQFSWKVIIFHST